MKQLCGLYVQTFVTVRTALVFCAAKRFLYFIKNKHLCLFRLFCILLLVFRKFMQKSRHFILLMYCCVGENVTSPHSFMNSEVLLYFETLTEICNCTPDV